MVAPPISTTASGPRPGCPAAPSDSSRAPSITAAGVGISTASNIAAAPSIPLAWTIRSMKMRRIASRAGPVSSSLKAGMTLPATTSGLPAAAKHAAMPSAASRLPAAMTGQSTALAASLSALCRITSLLPPSVPPASSSTSGASASMAARSAAFSR